MKMLRREFLGWVSGCLAFLAWCGEWVLGLKGDVASERADETNPWRYAICFLDRGYFEPKDDGGYSKIMLDPAVSNPELCQECRVYESGRNSSYLTIEASFKDEWGDHPRVVVPQSYAFDPTDISSWRWYATYYPTKWQRLREMGREPTLEEAKAAAWKAYHHLKENADELLKRRESPPMKYVIPEPGLVYDPKLGYAVVKQPKRPPVTFREV